MSWFNSGSTIPIAAGVKLRGFRKTDAPELFALVDAERARLRQWMAWLDQTTELSAIREFIAASRSAGRTGAALRLAIAAQEQIVGVIGLGRIDPVNRSAFVGYWIAAAHEGRGLITAAVAAVCSFGFGKLGLERIELEAATNNLRSRAVAERLGFTHEGTKRSGQWLYDHFVDHELYSVLAGEWRRRANEASASSASSLVRR